MLIIDARGHRCPVPTLKLQKAMAAAKVGEEIRLIADDPMARIDVPHFAQGAGHEIVACDEQPDGAVAFTVKKRA